MVSRKNRRQALFSTPETRSKKNQHKNIFKMFINGIGEVPMMFYIPDEKAREKLRPQIEGDGGIIVEHYEAYVYQIKPTRGLRSGAIKNSQQFYKGYVYNSQWIVDCIKRNKLMDEEKYLCGLNQESNLKVITGHKKRAYTVTEVLRIFDLVEEYGGNAKKVPPMKFWHEIEAKGYIPDRSGASMRTAYKKFAVTTRKVFVKSALKKSNGRFSHQFETIPDESSVCEVSPKKDTSCSKNLNNYYNSASTKVEVEADEPSPILPMVDLNVMTNQPSIIGGEDVEFFLQVEDMQSAISNQFAGDSSYTMNTNRKRKRQDNLDNMYESHEKSQGHKRKMINEADNNFEYTECDSTIYDQDSLYDHLRKEAKMRICRNAKTNERSVSSKVKNTGNFFQKITEELQELCNEYAISMEEMHNLFMSACCDMDELRKILESDKKNQEWEPLEDLAVACDPGSQEYSCVVKAKGEEAVMKRREFLEVKNQEMY